MLMDEKRKAVTLNDDGIDQVEKVLGITNLYSPIIFDVVSPRASFESSGPF